MFVEWPSSLTLTNIKKVIDEAGAERNLRTPGKGSGKMSLLEAIEGIEDEIRKVDTKKDPVHMTELQWK
jgi:hypothetical protein